MSNLYLQKHNNDYSNDTLKLTSQILEYNGDCYTAWNYRRRIFIEWEKYHWHSPLNFQWFWTQTRNHQTVQVMFLFVRTKSKEEMNKVYQEELQFLEKSIQAHPKSYWAWFHRKWVTQRPPCNCDWQRELALCTKALALDNRNCSFLFSDFIFLSSMNKIKKIFN